MLISYGVWQMGTSSTLPTLLPSPFATRRSDRRGVISIRPYVNRLAQHFGLLNTAAQSSSLTFIGQMSPQGISSMLSMRMIEKWCGTYPLQYHLAQSTEEEDLQDITCNSPVLTLIRIAVLWPQIWGRKIYFIIILRSMECFHDFVKISFRNFIDRGSNLIFRTKLQKL